MKLIFTQFATSTAIVLRSRRIRNYERGLLHLTIIQCAIQRIDLFLRPCLWHLYKTYIFYAAAARVWSWRGQVDFCGWRQRRTQYSDRVSDCSLSVE